MSAPLSDMALAVMALMKPPIPRDVESVAELLASVRTEELARAALLVEALRRIAFEPYGHAEATDGELLEAMAKDARKALAEYENGGK